MHDVAMTHGFKRLPGKKTMRCAICRKAIDKEATAIPLTLESKNGLLKLLFDKKECVIIFEKLRKYYGNEFFSDLESASKEIS